MALFYRNGSTEKGSEYLKSMSSLVTDLGTDPDLVTQVWISCSPHLSNQSSFYIFTCASETNFIMAWTWISSSVSDGDDIIQKKN